MASNSAVLQPQSYPCLTATAPMNKPIPKIDFSMPTVSLLNLIESRWRILPLTHTLISPSAFPRSFWVSKLFAVILKKGPRVWSWRSTFWALDAFNISDMVGIVASVSSFLFSCNFDVIWVVGMMERDLM